MKKYELMTIYPLDDEKSKKGAEDVRNTLASFSAEIEKEDAEKARLAAESGYIPSDAE